MTRKFTPTPYLFLAPALVLIAIFVVYPIGAVVYYSFTDYAISTPPVWIGLDNYEKLVGDPTFWLALTHSIVYLLVTPILIVLSIGLAIIVNRRLRGIHIFRALYYVPAVSGSIAIGISWRWLFDTNGLINSLLISCGLHRRADPVALGAGRRPPDRDAPHDLGRRRLLLGDLPRRPPEHLRGPLRRGPDRRLHDLQKHRYVSVPGLRPQIVFVAVISSLAALKVFDEIYVLTNKTGGILDSGTTVVFFLWEQAFRLTHAGYASAIAIVLLLITLIFSIVNVRLLDRRAEAD